MTSFDQVGDEDWRGVAAAVLHAGRVYAVANGTLYVVNPDDGSYEQLGNESWKSQFLLSAGGRLLSLEETGTLYEVLADGDYRTTGGDWRNTSAAAAHGDAFYATANGVLYKGDPDTGGYQTAPGEESWRSRILLSLGSRLYSVEESGTLYWYDPETGASGRLEGDWRRATAGAAARGSLWLLASGTWYRVDPDSGADHALEMDTSWDTAVAVPSPDGRSLLCFERSGSLWRFSLVD